MRAMRRYRESFIARKRAPTRQVFRPDAFDCKACPRTRVGAATIQTAATSRLCRNALARDGRYRESFIARERAPTKQAFRPGCVRLQGLPTHARGSEQNHTDRSDITLV